MKVADETRLVETARAGDRAAFDTLAGSCRTWLYGLCVRLVHDRGTAEDLVQEALLRAYRDLPQLRDPARFHAWLTRIAVNACRMYLRRRLGMPDESPVIPDGLAGSEQTAEDRPVHGVADALARLDETNRRVVLLFYDEELSHAEIAQVMSLSAAAVKSRLHRAREELRKEMLAMMSDQQKQKLGVGEERWELRTVLLVEPEEALRVQIAAALRQAGYEVLVLPTGEAALQAIEQRRGQFLILDKHCVEPHWIEVLTLVQVDEWSREHVPVCVVADGGADSRDISLAWQAGAQVYMTRPPDVGALLKNVSLLADKWWAELRKETYR